MQRDDVVMTALQIYDAAGVRQVQADFVVEFTATNGTNTLKSTKLTIKV
jgi:hypothetical protein